MARLDQTRLWSRIRPLLWDPPRWWAALRRNVALKLLSIVAAGSLWLFVNAGARNAELPLQVPIELRNFPSRLMLISPRVDFVDVLVAGPRTILSRIDRNRLLVALDLAGTRPGPSVFRINAEVLDLPRGVQILRVNPSQVTLELARIRSKTVPVQLEVDGTAPEGLIIGGVTVAPQSVEVVGPEGEVAKLESISTAPVEITGTEAGAQQIEVALESPGDFFSLSAQRVTVEIRLEDQVVSRELLAKVQVRNATYDAAVHPEQVRVTLRGPKRTLSSLELGEGAVYIDAANEEPGSYTFTPRIELPRGVDVAGLSPSTVRLELSRPRGKHR